MATTNTTHQGQASGNIMPDVASQPHAGPKGALNWVGMSEIEIPVFVLNNQGEKIQTLAHVQAYVNLADPDGKGIHMSRLFLALDEMLAMHELTPELLHKTVQRFVTSQHGLSTAAFLQCRFDYFEKRPSLKSNNRGWRSYPVKLTAMLRDSDFSAEIALDVPYSSTCPCSAALARQLIQEGFRDAFGADGEVDAEAVYRWLGTSEGINATPHSQRSMAQVKVKLGEITSRLPLSALIDRVEHALQTPVQSVVKREDEQEFARLNAANLMFCEDSARRLLHALSADSSISDFWIRVNHLESLHAHDAVAVVVKGVEGGYSDEPGEFISS
ncbi:MAG: GTP cyclohydrolase FolE2 [Thiolinea sp.]